MPTTEPVQQGPHALPNDPPDGPNQQAAIVTWAAGRTNMRFASTAARDAAIPVPISGMESYIEGAGKFIYHNARWVPVQSESIAAKRSGGLSTAQKIAHATKTIFNPGTAGARYTGGAAASGSGISVPVDGWYELKAGVRFGFSGNGTGSCNVYLTVNGGNVATNEKAATGTTSVHVDAHEYLRAGDVITGEVYQSSGSELAISSSFGHPYLSVAKVAGS